MKPNKKAQGKISKGLSLLILLIITLATWIFNQGESEEVVEKQPQKGKDFAVHMIDVGQGDSIYIRSGDYHMLIDGGNNPYGQEVVTYLKEQKVTRLDYLIGTHPDADHIGGLDHVIKAFEIGKIYMPKVQSSTKTFEEVIDAVLEKNLKVMAPKGGETVEFGDAKVKFLGPLKKYEDNNNNSIVMNITYGSNEFLFTGDMETEAEADMVEAGYDLKADFLKVAHHGSSTGTTEEFLELVNPQYAVISCGKDNSYGHPHRETIEKLQDRKIQFFRTDEEGTLIFYSDGKKITK